MPMTLPPETDPGPRALSFVRERLQAEDAWIEARERGFTWWGSALALHVDAEAPRHEHGATVARVHVRADLLRDVAVARGSSILGALASGVALAAPFVTGDPGGARLQLALSLHVFPGGEAWTLPHLAFAAALAAAQAHAMAERLATLLDAQVDASAHPRSGPREHPDEILFLLEHLVRPRGEDPSPWTPQDAERAFDNALGPLGIAARRDGEWRWAPFPTSRGDAILVVAPAAARAGLGSGAVVRAVMPEASSPPLVVAALDLVRDELVSPTPAPVLSGWYPDGSRVAHEVFLPSASHDEGVLDAILLGSAMRVRWLDRREPL